MHKLLLYISFIRSDNVSGKKLNFGDTIGIIAPASPEDPSVIQKQIAALEKLHFKVKIGRHLYDRYGYLAGRDADRADDLMDMFMDDSVKAIMCCRGGYGAMRILPYIDFTAIRKNHKIFIGYSDITTLLNNMALHCDLITFHGPMLTTNLQDECTMKSLLGTLMKGTKPYQIDNPPSTPFKFLGSNSAEGMLVGGNLSLICSTIGTPYEIDMKDKILFIEEVGEVPYRVDRLLSQLALSGKLHSCKGFILGQFTDCSAEKADKSLSLEQVIEDRLLCLNKPTILNLMSGHDYPKLTLPIGARVRMDFINQRLHVLEAVVH
jgi:muramoyltetrapeptide carboxypeptidase